MIRPLLTCLEKVYKMKIAIISFTKQGDEIALKLSDNLSESELFLKKHQDKTFNLSAKMKVLMDSFAGIIFIASTGIAVRAIAPHLKGKDRDPAVVVVDCLGKYAISLLSGHLGGANALALKVSEILRALPIITTATDALGIEAPDVIAKNYGLEIEDLEKAKNIAAMLVEGKAVAFKDERNTITLPKGYVSIEKSHEGAVVVTHKKLIPEENLLRLITKDIVLGIGCRKNYEYIKMKNNIINVLDSMNIDLRAVGTIATVEVKKEEKAILQLAEELKADLKIYSLEEIKNIEHKYLGSDFVEKNIGVRAVCEPCVELTNAELISEKLNLDGMTLCVGGRRGTK